MAQQLRTSFFSYVPLIALSVFALFLFFAVNPVVIIGAGDRGVVFNRATGIEERVLGEGVHFRLPFVESVTSMTVRVQKDDVEAEAASKDLQTISMHVVVNYHLDAGRVNKIYQQIGDEEAVIDSILKPAVNEVVKAATAKLTAEEILTKRPELKANIDKLLKERLISYNIILDDVSIVNVSFSREFNAAIESKQVAEQDAQRARFVALKAEQEAQAEINRAKGAAEAQRLQQQTLTQEILQKQAIEKWDGKFPQYFSGDQLPFLNIRP
jgi:prohibitin 1